MLVWFGETVTNKHVTLCSLIQNRVIERQYHTYFDWEGSNANKFFGMFGSEFREKCAADVKADPALKQSIVAFLNLGNTRNQTIHLNFASFTMDKTVEEAYALYKKALAFVDYLKNWFSV
jgi:hypothetical protein